jgi:hypothetical protein
MPRLEKKCLFSDSLLGGNFKFIISMLSSGVLFFIPVKRALKRVPLKGVLKRVTGNLEQDTNI